MVKKEIGYKVCNHSCVSAACISRATKTILWNKEGNSATRHSSNTKIHSECDGNCPANAANDVPVMVRSATADELARWVPKIEGTHSNTRSLQSAPDVATSSNAPSHSVVMDAPEQSSSVGSRASQLVASTSRLSLTPSYAKQTSAESTSPSRTSGDNPDFGKDVIKVIFVADPTRYSTLADAEEWNCVYTIYPTISQDEFSWLRSTFPNSIFRNKKNKTYIQEFVSVPD